MNRTLLIMVFGFLFTSACATVGGLRQEPIDQGVARRYPFAFDSVMTVVPDAVVAAGLGLKESQCFSGSHCMVIGTKGLTIGPAGNWGSMARVVVEADGDATVVRVITRRRMGDEESAQRDYSPEILSQIAVRLGLSQE